MMGYKKMLSVIILLLAGSLPVFGQKSIVLNDFPKRDIFYHAGLNKPLARFDYLQISQHFKAPEPGGILVSVSLSRLILDNGDARLADFQRTKFRLCVYSKDEKSGGPDIQLTNNLIEVVNKSSEYISIDLKPYNIRLPETDFFVAVVYIRDTYNERLVKTTMDGAIPINTGTSTFKFVASYQPFVGMSPVKGSEINTWVMNMDGKWGIYDYFSPELTDFAISAKILLK